MLPIALVMRIIGPEILPDMNQIRGTATRIIAADTKIEMFLISLGLATMALVGVKYTRDQCESSSGKFTGEASICISSPV